jgi:hypothetical protein
MKSTIASLRSLTLPFGATSGGRIVLDGVTGKIQIYDSNNDLVLELASELTGTDPGTGGGLAVYDPDTALRATLVAPDIWPGAATLVLLSNAPNETTAGMVSIDAADLYDVRQYLTLSAGDRNSKGDMLFYLASAASDDSLGAMLQVDCFPIGATSPQPIVDFTGASIQPGADAPRVIVHDLWSGTAIGSLEPPTQVQSYGRGAHPDWFAEAPASDVVLSTTNGVYTTLVEVTDVPCLQGRTYEVIYTGADNLLTGGSGFAASDNWRYRIHRKVGAGSYLSMGCQNTIRANVAAGARFPVPPLIGYFSPTADALVDFKAEAAKVAGASTVTSEFEVAAGDCDMQIQVKDIGAASSWRN